MLGLAILAAAFGAFFAALAGCWLALYWAIRWAAFAMSRQRARRLRRQRAGWAILGVLAGLGCAALGFLGIALLMRYSVAP